MLPSLEMFVNRLLGLELDATALEFRHMAWRTLVVFVCAVLFARLAERRLLGHMAGFDIVVLVILGSVLSRAINGQSAFFPTLGASVLLVGLHRVLAAAAFHWHGISVLVKGRPKVLLRDGRIDEAALRRTKITHDDLDESLRLNGGVAHAEQVVEARLERNGTVSVVKARDAVRAQ